MTINNNKTNNNNMMCDLETGICGPVGEGEGAGGSADGIQLIDFSAPKKTVDLYYVTDPICSHCWALEPVLRKFVDQYGQYFNMHTLMGGLLEKWDGFTDASNGISSPADVAGHWREVGVHSRMPIDGTVWHDNPISSSYIPSRVYKVIQAIDSKKANTFLRRAREELFAFNKNIAEDDVLIEIVNELGLGGEDVVQQAKLPEADEALQQDFAQVRQLGVRGFPTIVMVNEEQKGVRIVGARSFEQYVEALQQLLPDEKISPQPLTKADELLQRDKVLFSRELEEYYAIEQSAVERFIQSELTQSDYEINTILGENYIQLK